MAHEWIQHDWGRGVIRDYLIFNSQGRRVVKKNKQIKENIQKLRNNLKKSKKHMYTSGIPEKNREEMGNKKYLKR